MAQFAMQRRRWVSAGRSTAVAQYRPSCVRFPGLEVINTTRSAARALPFLSGNFYQNRCRTTCPCSPWMDYSALSLGGFRSQFNSKAITHWKPKVSAAARAITNSLSDDGQRLERMLRPFREVHKKGRLERGR